MTVLRDKSRLCVKEFLLEVLGFGGYGIQWFKSESVACKANILLTVLSLRTVLFVEGEITKRG